ncbi:MAG: methyl-accepting chemotaxis protein [Desulfomonile tiedjei]|nr:methyl-accepting chemotaxis protein [Desulfomonile tiedjei]
MAKLVGYFLLVALVPIGIVGYLSFSKGTAALREATVASLTASRDRARDDVNDYFTEMLGDMNYLGTSSAVQSSFKTLADYLTYASFLDYGKAHPDAPVDINSTEFKKTLAELDPMFVRFVENFEAGRGYQDLLLVVGKEEGLILYSVKKLPDLGASVASSGLKSTKLSELWAKVVKTEKPALVDFSQYEPAGSIGGFMGVPVFRDDKKLYGVLVLRFSPAQIGRSMARMSQIGRTGDAFLIGQDQLLRSGTRTRPTARILAFKIETPGAKDVVAGKADVQEIVGMRGVPTLSAWTPLGLAARDNLGADFDWGIIAQMDSSEAFGSVRAIGLWIMMVAVLIASVVAVSAFLLARTIARPMAAIAEQASHISEGDLTVEIPELKRADELGDLARAFRLMAGNLRYQIKQVLEGVSVLSSSAAEISTTVAEVAASTSQTSSAVTETSATVEQLKQAARMSGDKAKKVAAGSIQAVKISESGKKATDDTIERMGLIRDQMESIGETVVKLSDHSRAIEEIITTVKDLADQSNLLAVNASIEAARAGDYGKGFAVVAQEIKALADQSKQATDQVRAILEETHKWVSAVVMATEQGTKAVEAGVDQSAAAGRSIDELAKRVADSAQAAEVIDTSAEQQSAGVHQVSDAMSNIESAVKQNLDGALQLENAARRLEDLGSMLKQLVERYKV